MCSNFVSLNLYLGLDRNNKKNILLILNSEKLQLKGVLGKIFRNIEKYLERFVFEQALSLTLQNKFNVWRRMRRMDTDAEQQDVSALTSSTQVESGTLMHNMI